MKVAKHVSGQQVYLLVGDELVVPGLPQHKMIYVGPIGPRGEDVVDPAKGQPAIFAHFDTLPDRDQVFVGERGTTDWNAMLEIQNRARDIVSRRIVNMGIRPNCEHICTYIRTGRAKSPQLRFWGGVAAVAVGLILARAK